MFFKQMNRQARKALSYKVEIFEKKCPKPLHERCSEGSTALWAQVLTKFGLSGFQLYYLVIIIIFGGVLHNISPVQNYT